MNFERFKPFNCFAPFNPPPFFEAVANAFLPRDAGEDQGGGLNVLNGWNDWNVLKEGTC